MEDRGARPFTWVGDGEIQYEADLDMEVTSQEIRGREGKDKSNFNLESANKKNN